MNVPVMRSRRVIEPRVLAFPVTMFVLLCLLFFRLFYLQVILGPSIVREAGISNAPTQVAARPASGPSSTRLFLRKIRRALFGSHR